MLRAGGEVYADTLVEEILLEGGRAVGIRAVMRSPVDRKPIVEIKAKAPRVILAAGAVNTPLLLQKQNLANSSGMVGKNLHCHPGVGAIAKFREDIMIWKGATQGFYGHHPEDPEILLETFSASPDIFVAQAGSVGMEAMQFIKDLRKIAARSDFTPLAKLPAVGDRQHVRRAGAAVEPSKATQVSRTGNTPLRIGEPPLPRRV